MRSICPLSVPSSGEYVYVTAEPISLPYSRLLLLLLHPPLIFPSVPQRCHRRSSFPSVYCPSVSLSLPTSLPITLWLYQVWSQRPVRLAQRHCLPLSLSLSLSLSLARSHTHVSYPCSRFPCLEVGPYRFTGRSVSVQVLLEGETSIPYLFRYYLRWWRSKKREGIYIWVYWSFFFSCYFKGILSRCNVVEFARTKWKLES